MFFNYLINFNADKHEIGTSQAHNFIVVNGIMVKVQLSVRPKRLMEILSEKRIDITYRNGCVSFDAEPLNLHGIYMIE